MERIGRLRIAAAAHSLSLGSSHSRHHECDRLCTGPSRRNRPSSRAGCPQDLSDGLRSALHRQEPVHLLRDRVSEAALHKFVAGLSDRASEGEGEPLIRDLALARPYHVGGVSASSRSSRGRAAGKASGRSQAPVVAGTRFTWPYKPVSTKAVENPVHGAWITVSQGRLTLALQRIAQMAGCGLYRIAVCDFR
jgi:hypothetical protein